MPLLRVSCPHHRMSLLNYSLHFPYQCFDLGFAVTVIIWWPMPAPNCCVFEDSFEVPLPAFHLLSAGIMGICHHSWLSSVLKQALDHQTSDHEKMFF